MKKFLILLAIVFQLLVVCASGQTRIEASSQLMFSVNNDGTTGTTINQLAKANASGNAINIGTSDTSIPVFVVVGGAGTTGAAQLADAGAISCKFDASGGTIGHYVQASTATGGRCMDAGATAPTSGWVVGLLLSSPGANALGTVLLYNYPAGGGGGGGVSSVSGTTNQIASTGGTTPVLSITNPFIFPGEATYAAATTGAASNNTPSGTAPTSPAAGDFWRDTNGFNFVESITTNGSIDVRADQAGSVGPANNVRYTADSNVAKYSENGAALQEVVGRTKTQTIQNKTFDSSDIGLWQISCTSTSTTSTITCTPTVARVHYMCRLLIGGYSGGGGVARAEFGNTSTVDTGTNYAFAGINLASGTLTTPTVSGIGSGSSAQEGAPVSGSTTTAGRFVQLQISDRGTAIKYFTIETSGVGASAAVTPNLAHIAGIWNNTTAGIGVIQFKACSATTSTCSTVNFTATTRLTCWGRDDN